MAPIYNGKKIHSRFNRFQSEKIRVPNNEISTMRIMIQELLLLLFLVVFEMHIHRQSQKTAANHQMHSPSVEWHCSTESVLVFYDFNFEIFSCKKILWQDIVFALFISLPLTLVKQYCGAEMYCRIESTYSMIPLAALHPHLFSISVVRTNAKKALWKYDRNMSGWFLLVYREKAPPYPARCTSSDRKFRKCMHIC